MRSSAVICATVGALALTGIVTMAPAQARVHHPGAYAYAPGHGWGRGYWRSRGPYYHYGVFQESQHGGPPSYSWPLGK